MAKRIEPQEYVDQEFTNKKKEKFVVTKFEFKEKSNYYFNIKFENGNEQLATLNQIRNKTCYDLVERKKQKRIKTEKKLRERTKLVAKTKKTCVLPANLQERNILSIDLSTTSTGIAYSQQGKIVRWKTIKPFDNKDFRERGLNIIEELAEILETGKIDLVILEDIYLGLNSKILIMLSEIRGMLTYHLQKLGIELLLVPAVFWKNRVSKDVPFTRKEQKQFMMDKFYELTGVEADSDDAADAYMMLHGCLHGEDKESWLKKYM